MQVTSLEALLFRSESESLDFKREQYRFEGLSDDEKAELVKDILAFANAWRAEPAHILIGVNGEAGGGGRVVGIPPTEHLPDASLQQLVNSKTNRPVPFRYLTLEIRGLSVGVIQIDRTTDRPFFLKRRYGRLAPNIVYVRRGSSTAEAQPDEVARMGADDVARASVPRLQVSMIDVATEVAYGGDVALPAISRHLVDPPPAPRRLHPFDPLGNLAAIQTISSILGRDPTPEAEYRYRRAMLRLHPIKLWAKNPSAVTARDVRIEIIVPAVEGLRFIDDSDTPAPPGELYRLPNIHRNVDVSPNGDGWIIHARVGKLQPGQETRTDKFYVEAAHDLEVTLDARVFADNLPSPEAIRFRVAVKVEDCSSAEKDDVAEAP